MRRPIVALSGLTVATSVDTRPADDHHHHHHIHTIDEVHVTADGFLNQEDLADLPDWDAFEDLPEGVDPTSWMEESKLEHLNGWKNSNEIFGYTARCETKFWYMSRFWTKFWAKF